MYYEQIVLFVCSPEIVRLCKNIDNTFSNNNATSTTLNDKPIHHTQSYRFVIMIYNY